MTTMTTAPNGSSPPKPPRPRADDGRRQRQIATTSGAALERHECAFQRRFSADTMAVSDAVMVFVLMPTP